MPLPGKLSKQTLNLDMPELEQVGTLARIGAVWSALLFVGRQLLNMGFTAVLARMLNPSDYGMIGMVATLTGLLMVFSDMGLSWATVQRKGLTAAQVHNLFWINSFVGLSLWAICVLLAPAVAEFYGYAELTTITIALGANFAIAGVAVQPIALLKRRMRFKPIVAIELFSVVIGGVVAITFAIQGWGYWALVAQALASQLVNLVLALGVTGYRPSTPTRGVGTSSLLRFGGLLAVNGLLIYFARNLDSVFIGKVWGTQQLGYYNRAYFLMLLPSILTAGLLAQVMTPSLSAFQGDPVRFAEAYRRAARLTAYIGCPMALGLAIAAPEAIRLVYGSAWTPVVPILTWLSIASVSQPIYNTYGWLFVAAGKAKSYLKVTLLNAVALTLGFAVSVRFGAIAVAAVYAIVMTLLLTGPALYFAHRAVGFPMRLTIKAILPVLTATAIMGICAYGMGILAQFVGANWMLVFAIKVGAGLLSYGFASVWLLKPMLKTDILAPLARKIGPIGSRV